MSDMRLWHLSRRDTSNPAYDVSNGFVVRAESEDAARKIASSSHGDEGAGVWLTRSGSTCELLTTKGGAGIIIHDFNAG